MGNNGAGQSLEENGLKSSKEAQYIAKLIQAKYRRVLSALQEIKIRDQPKT